MASRVESLCVGGIVVNIAAFQSGKSFIATHIALVVFKLKRAGGPL